MPVVHVIDVESGNLQSLTNAIEHLGYEVQLVKSPKDFNISGTSRLILPGVGNYGHFVDNLFNRGFEKPIREYIESGKPIMGICVGLQALFAGSVESPKSTGLNYIDFKLSRFDDSEKPVPEIGWNSCIPSENLFFGLDPYKRYYFVHSFAAILNSEKKKNLENDGWKIAKAKYGSEEFIAAVNKNNIFATQFHPEKSGKAGLNIIENFLKQQSPPIPNYSAEEKELLMNDYSNYGLTRRIIACLDVRTNDQGDLVVTKGDQYDVRKKFGSLTLYSTTSFYLWMLEVSEQAAKTVFVPLTVGGGIKDIVDVDGTKIPALEVASLYFRSGADKVSIAGKYYFNRGDGTSPIETISKAYGAQAVVISVDPKRVYVNSQADTKNKVFETEYPGPNGEKYCWYQCTIKGGRESRDLGVWELTRACEALGAGEILLNCIDKDGSNSGYDLELIEHVKDAVKIPVIASSGAGVPEHFEEAFLKTRADACLGAGMFHRGEFTVNDVKEYLLEHGLKVRMDEE
ncbi:CPS_HP_G0101990.mRNA.1.CDS.1 [Saccharomyces cerevisiae]|nr:CPS_HP_G0101990.mRNA.1.CDS.1 [Saccharomyces cerevisiae]CAI6948168.1 CPS_HP_G0101990.mRNA.1.CDS.1 [Saccharomyces cerevisiae]